MSEGVTEFTYTRAQLERLTELVKCNSYIASALSIMISDGDIPANLSEVIGLWMYKAEQIKGGRDLLAEFDARKTMVTLHGTA